MCISTISESDATACIALIASIATSSVKKHFPILTIAVTVQKIACVSQRPLDFDCNNFDDQPGLLLNCNPFFLFLSFQFLRSC